MKNLQHDRIKDAFNYLLQITDVFNLTYYFPFKNERFRQIIGASQVHMVSPQTYHITFYQHRFKMYVFIELNCFLKAYER